MSRTLNSGRLHRKEGLGLEKVLKPMGSFVSGGTHVCLDMLYSSQCLLVHTEAWKAGVRARHAEPQKLVSWNLQDELQAPTSRWLYRGKAPDCSLEMWALLTLLIIKKEEVTSFKYFLVVVDSLTG